MAGVKERTGVWSALDRAIDPSLQRPRLRPDIEVARFTTRWGGSYAMVKNPRGPAYFRIGSEEGALLPLMDGSRSVNDLVVENLERSGSLDLAAVIDLVQLLYENDFLERPWVDAYELSAKRLHPESRFRAGLRRLVKTQTIHFPKAERFTEVAYRLGGRFIFTWPAHLVFIIIIGAGLVMFYLDVHSGQHHIVGDSLATGFGLLFALDLVATLLHELGHALAIRHAKRRVISAGFQLYLAHPAFFIDSSDILMAPPKDRMRNAWYGPYIGLVVAGLASGVAFLWPGVGISEVLFRLAVLTYLTVLLNLIPFLELDGYWVLTDALETTDLRPRSLAFLRYDLLDRIRERKRLTPREWGLTGFGIVGAIFTVLALWTSWWFWGPIFEGFIGSMWRAGVGGRIGLVVLGVLVLGPLLAALIRILRAAWRKVAFALGHLRVLVQYPWRREAASLIARLPLLDELSTAALDELAGRVTLESVAPGQPVIRQGEPADAFYIVRKGRLAIVDETPGAGGDVLRLAGRGEAFGELGLLEGRARTATVRAEEPSEVFRLDKSAFERFLAGSLVPADLAPSFAAVAEVWSLPPLRHLEPDEVADVAEAGEWLQTGAEEVIVREGERGEDFFIVASGWLHVTREGEVVKELRAGDFFGELALLRDQPRTATVTTKAPCRLFRLDRDAFGRLIASSFRRGALRPARHRERIAEKKG